MHTHLSMEISIKLFKKDAIWHVYISRVEGYRIGFGEKQTKM